MASDTPRLDAIKLSGLGATQLLMEYYTLCRTLERELRDANARADQARGDALEEAASVCEKGPFWMKGKDCAKAIRALINAAPQGGQNFNSAPSNEGHAAGLASAATPWYDRPESTNAAPQSEQSVQAPSGGQPQEAAGAAPNAAAVTNQGLPDEPMRLHREPPPAVPDVPPYLITSTSAPSPSSCVFCSSYRAVRQSNKRNAPNAPKPSARG